MWRYGFLFFVLLAGGMPLSGSEEIRSAEIDGELVDSGNDGIYDTVRLSPVQILVQNSSVRRIASIVEFPIPPGARPAEKVYLRLWLNGTSGTTAVPEHAKAFGPNTVLFGYLPPDADGKVTLSDDGCGERIAPLLSARPVSVKDPVLADVTDFYNRAVREKAARIGFRIEADDRQPGSREGWRFRTLKFARSYSGKWAPSLVIRRTDGGKGQ